MTTRAEEEALFLSLRSLRQILWPKLPPAYSMKDILAKGQDINLLTLSRDFDNCQLQQLFMRVEEKVESSSRLIENLRVDRLQHVELQERSHSLQALNDELTQAIDRLQNDFLVLLNAFQEKDAELKKLEATREGEEAPSSAREGGEQNIEGKTIPLQTSKQVEWVATP